jgi:hypothetical protein
VASARPVLVHDTGHGGVIVVYRQSIGGVDVVRSDLKVLMAEERRAGGHQRQSAPGGGERGAQEARRPSA